MHAPPVPSLLVCDAVSWRLDLFQQALDRVYAKAETAAIEVGYRSRDDLALVVVTPESPAPSGFGSTLVFEARLPGFRELDVPDASAVAARFLAGTDVLVRVPSAREVVSVLRGRLGMLSDSRAALRLRVAAPVRFESPVGWCDASTSDLSSGGLFVQTRILPDLGEQVRLQLFPNSRRGPIEALATVVRHTADGFGARLTLSTEAQSDLYRRVNARRVPAPAQPASLESLQPRPGTTHALSHAIAETLSHAHPRALVAVDDEARGLAICAALQSAGLETLRAVSLDEALSVLLEELLALDALIVDHTLHGENAEKLLFRIRQLGGESHLPILALTPPGTSADALLKAGADLVLSAGRPVEDLVADLRSLLVTRRQEALG